MNAFISLRQAAWTVLLGAVLGGVTACSTFEDVLVVENPTEIDESLLQDETLVKVLVAGVRGDFASANVKRESYG